MTFTVSVICAPGETACALTCVTTCGAAFTGALLSTETAWPAGATSRCALRAGLRFDGTKSVGRSAGRPPARARTRTPAPGSVGVKETRATPLEPVSTRAGSPSAPVALQRHLDVGHRAPGGAEHLDLELGLAPRDHPLRQRGAHAVGPGVALHLALDAAEDRPAAAS